MDSAALVILTLNEINGLKSLFARLPLSLFSEVLAVDGGSSDGTSEFLREKGIKVISQQRPGRGEAIKTGVLNTSSPLILFFSPDGNEDPGDMEKILEKFQENYELVIASRFCPGGCNEESGKLFPFRMWANRLFTLFANRLFKKNAGYITDSINGFRAIKREAFQALELTESGFPIEYQMTIRGLKKNLKVGEIPSREGKRLGGKSKALSVPVGLGHLKVLLRELIT